MKKLYEKSQLAFSLVLIALYVVIMSLADDASFRLRTEKLITAPVALLMVAFLVVWLMENRLLSDYGLRKPVADHKKYLYYVPLAILISANLWWGVQMNMSVWETALYIVSMLCVGFLEELIFRGLLFNAMRKNSLKAAVIVSSVTFGIGHVINLVNGSGAELLPNLLQVLYATTAGFMFAMIYYRSKSLLICIGAHGLFNALSAFANEKAATTELRIVFCLLLAAITGGYGAFLALSLKKGKNKDAV